jgi:hypothetical protein
MMRTSFLAVCLAVALPAVGCARKSFEDQLKYRDQRLVTTRPATDDDTEPDVLVRVERFNVRGMPERGGMPAVADLPAGAEIELAAESLASYGSPFYSTVERPRGRVEIGGKVERAGDDGLLRVEIDFGENGPGVVNQIRSRVMVRAGEAVVMSKTSDGSAPPRIRSVTVLSVSPYKSK